ncbi:MAG TPA: methyltransferase [Candidatus Xenobia bacterium]|nr:methyltransferase [Candidatus Xenobia bacterium]
MRFAVLPDSLRERFIVSSRRFPLPLFDVMGAMLVSRTIMAGVHFGIFDRLASGSRSAAELAADTGCNEHAVELLLNALAHSGYLERKNGSYCNSRLAERWLRSDQPQTLANFIRFNYDQWEWVSQLERYIERGEASDIHARLDAPHWRSYMLGLRDIASLSADEVARRIHVRSTRSLLDVGAGHCLYSIVMCRRHPSLRVTVVDLEPAARVGQELVAQAGLTDRFTFNIGCLTATPFGENHDVAFLFNVMHHLDRDSNRIALRRLCAALKPGGKLVISETFREARENERQDQFESLLALYFGVTSKRETLEFDQVAAWAREAGFTRIARKKLQSTPLAALLVATK